MIIVSNACTEERFGSRPTWVADTSCHDTPGVFRETSRKRLRYSNYENLVEICQRLKTAFHPSHRAPPSCPAKAAAKHRARPVVL